MGLEEIKFRGRWLAGIVFVFVACLSLVSSAHAHAESLSGLKVVLRDDGTHVSMSLPARELSRWFPPSQYPDYDPQVAAALEKTDLVQVQYGDATPPVATHVISHVGSDATIVIESDFAPLPRNESALAVWSTSIGNLPNDHKQFLTVEDQRAGVDRVVAQDTLTAIQDAWSGTLPDLPTTMATTTTTQSVRAATPAERAAKAAAAAPGGPSRVTSFFLLGVEHILNGYDHLLFLAALLLVCDRFADAAKVVTVFTVAHSVTLALAALDVVRLPGRVVEPLIAASIVYVAFENLVIRDKAQRWRRVVVFCFGLIHGLGFAAALREVGLGTGFGIALPLVKFNLGVETGQLAVASLVLPLIFWLKRHPTFVARGMPIASAAIASVGAFWLFTRLFDGG